MWLVQFLVWVGFDESQTMREAEKLRGFTFAVGESGISRFGSKGISRRSRIALFLRAQSRPWALQIPPACKVAGIIAGSPKKKIVICSIAY
jgi:hypothetical protein